MKQEIKKEIEENFTMEDKCFVCKKKQGINEPYEILELKEGHISFCSEKCKKIHYRYGKDMLNLGKQSAEKELEELQQEFNCLDEAYTCAMDRYARLEQQLSQSKDKIIEIIEEFKTEMINVWTNKDFNSELLNLTCHDEMCDSEVCGCKEIIENRFKELLLKINDDGQHSAETESKQRIGAPTEKSVPNLNFRGNAGTEPEGVGVPRKVTLSTSGSSNSEELPETICPLKKEEVCENCRYVNSCGRAYYKIINCPDFRPKKKINSEGEK